MKIGDLFIVARELRHLEENELVWGWNSVQEFHRGLQPPKRVTLSDNTPVVLLETERVVLGRGGFSDGSSLLFEFVMYRVLTGQGPVWLMCPMGDYRNEFAVRLIHLL